MLKNKNSEGVHTWLLIIKKGLIFAKYTNKKMRMKNNNMQQADLLTKPRMEYKYLIVL
jgi:hypothetical protein